MRLRIAAVVITFVVSALAAYTATGSVEGHGNHCGGAHPPCNTGNSRHFVGQGSIPGLANSTSNGIYGRVGAQNVAILDQTCANMTSNPQCDHISHALQMQFGADFMTIGFTEGCCVGPGWGSYVNPIFFTEVQSGCFGWWFFTRSTPSLEETPSIRWKGGSGSGCGFPAYIWIFERNGGTPFDVGFTSSSQGTFAAFTEHFNNTHMEPNGTQCFGGGWCRSIYGLALQRWNQGTQTFSLWDSTVSTSFQEGNGYFHTPASGIQWYGFNTTGTW